MLKNILFPYLEKRVVSTVLFSLKSMYPLSSKESFFSATPIGFIIAVIPLFADLITYLPLSIALKILCV